MNVRDALRTRTSPAHDALDSRMSPLDLSTSAGLRTFLTISAAGWSLLSSVGPAATALSEMREALSADLRAMGEGAPSVPAVRPARHPLAGAYLVLGSRLGLALLARRFPAAPARRYVGLPPRGADWRALCATLSAMPADSAEGYAVVADACAHFEDWSGIAASCMGEVADVA